MIQTKQQQQQCLDQIRSNLLKEHVEKYVNVDPDIVAYPYGSVELENLALKRTHWCNNLPVKVIDGRVSKLSLIIP